MSDALLQAIETVRGAGMAVSAWVPVGERLPDAYKIVEVRLDDGAQWLARVNSRGMWEKASFQSCRYQYMLSNVSFWLDSSAGGHDSSLLLRLVSNLTGELDSHMPAENLDALDAVFELRCKKKRIQAIQRHLDAIRAVFRASQTGAQLLRELETDRLADVIRESLEGTLVCTRAWSAWGAGTMSQDDFDPVPETEIPDEIAAAIINKLGPRPGE